MMNTNTTFAATGFFSGAVVANQNRTPSEIIAVAIIAVEEAIGDKTKHGYKKEALKKIKKEGRNLLSLTEIYKGQFGDIMDKVKATLRAADAILKSGTSKEEQTAAKPAAGSFFNCGNAENSAVGLFRGKAATGDAAKFTTSPDAAECRNSCDSTAMNDAEIAAVREIRNGLNLVALNGPAREDLTLASFRKPLFQYLKKVVEEGSEFKPSEIYAAGKSYADLYVASMTGSTQEGQLADTILPLCVPMIMMMEDDANVDMVHALVDQLDAARDQWLAAQIRSLQEKAEATPQPAPGETAQARTANQAAKPRTGKK